MYNITETDREFETLLRERMTDFEKDFEKNFLTQEATLDLLSTGVNISDFLNYKSNRQIWNAACFVNIASYDLKVIVRSMLLAQGEWERRVFARQASLLIYEIMNDLFDLFGKDFRKTILGLLHKDQFEGQLKIIKKELNAYKELNFEKLKIIRNVSIAHREKDTIEQLKIIKSISWCESINMVSAFDKILNSAGRFLQELTSRSRELDDIE